MKESEYFANQERIHQLVADDPCFEAWVRAANRASAAECRRAAREALSVEAREDRIAETEDRDEQAALEDEIDEIRHNQEARYEGLGR